MAPGWEAPRFVGHRSEVRGYNYKDSPARVGGGHSACPTSCDLTSEDGACAAILQKLIQMQGRKAKPYR